MITDKDKIGRYMDRVESFIPNDILNDFSDEIFDGTSFQPEEIKACAEWVWLRASDQARKEAAERVACAWREHREDITLRILREAILGDSVIKENSITDHIPDIGKKLAIAVKALEKIQKQGTYNPLGGRTLSGERIDSEKIINEYGIIARDALKEIQG